VILNCELHSRWVKYFVIPATFWGRAGTNVAGEARIGPLAVLPELLKDMEVDPRRALRQAGIAPRLFENPAIYVANCDRLVLRRCRVVFVRLPRLGRDHPPTVAQRQPLTQSWSSVGS
jgi:hypothetical protein